MDAAFDLGWEAGQSAIRDGLKAQEAQARLDGFEAGFAAGFKEGRIIGRGERD